ncbi:hypothetical protein TCAL_09312 [Tigriopus californicus]|uniref:Integrin alpha second immunoglobulin-like domain-containing protein n=1 Tax=Tigriopus californicus TaxID=6832 RepID=A0A553PJZ4_TIGCA|nr:hypothetical protein TCAL_09312 [Tigriopus californicus]
MLHKKNSNLCLVISAYFFVLLLSVRGYVLDEGSPIFIRHESVPSVKSHFGFSHDLHQDEQGKIRAFVGAPKDRHGWGLKPDEIGGSFSVCDLNVSNQSAKCTVRTPSMPNAEEKDTFLDQMLGISVMTTGDKVWTCAPRFQRFKQKIWENGLQEYQMMLGHCFIFSEDDGFTTNRHVVPLDKKPVFFGRAVYGEKEYAYGATYSETGFSLHASDDDMFMGAPGAWNWTGTMVATNTVGENPVMTQPWSPSEPILNDYTGFALSSGKLLRNAQSGVRPRHMVLGAPRAGRNRAGSVFAVGFDGSATLTQISKAKGRQIGEYFGSALATVDVNGDGLDEVLVGAPFFVEDLKNQRYEQGRVAILEVINDNSFIERASLSGPRKSSGRFGSAVASLGDIDLDGYGDFVVGAPYEDNGHGAIHIYMGKKDIASIQGRLLVFPEASQIIRAQTLKATSKGFGISFSKVLDVDKNGVPDIAVGCHDSGEVALLRASPSAILEVESRSSESTITLENTSTFQITAFVALKTRVKNSKGQGQVQVKITFLKDPRTTFVNAGSQNNISVTKVVHENQGAQVSQQVQLKSPHFNAMGPLIFETLVEQMPRVEGKFCPECQVLDPRIAYKSSVQVELSLNCDPGKNCGADLSLAAGLKDTENLPFVIGSSKSLTIAIMVRNEDGENAISPTIALSIPDKLSIKQMPGCKEENREIVCTLTNIVKGSAVITEITFDVSALTAGESKILFKDIRVDSYYDDLNDANNKKSLEIPLESQVDLKVLPLTIPSTALYNEMDELVAFKQSFQVSAEVNCKRDQTEQDEEGLSSELSVSIDKMHITCDSPKFTCVTYRCPRVDLSNRSTVATISLQLILDLTDIKEKDFQFSSDAKAALDFPLDSIQINPGQARATTVIRLESNAILTASLPTWLWIVVVISALLVLLLIILCMTKFGFFRRKRMEEMRNEKEARENTAKEMENAIWQSPGLQIQTRNSIEFPENEDVIEQRMKLLGESQMK